MSSSASRSLKSAIVEIIFYKLWDEKEKRLIRTEVTFDDIREAIHEFNEKTGSNVSPHNPANFFKDGFTRNTKIASLRWPESIRALGFSARALTGSGRSFEFVRLDPNQKTVFSSAVDLPGLDIPNHSITSAVLPMAVRALTRRDESSILQLVVRLRIVESHMAFYSPRKATIRQIDHLQNSMKLKGSEIDAVFLVVEEPEPDKIEQFLITCEAKGAHEDVTEDQILRQPQAILKVMTKVHIVVPIAVRSLGDSRLHVTEFQAIHRAEAGTVKTLIKVSEAIYTLSPPIPGL